jgi:predicted CXXCH cytochrome family protein
MPSTFRSPKSLSNWIELDYFRRRRLFRGWWAWLAGVAGAALLCLVALVGANGYRTFQAGPLTTAHAMFNNDCSLCHQDNGATLVRLVRGERVGSVPDHACLKCHAGAPHNSPHAEMGRCVRCHKEHRGHDALVRIADPQCVRCHAELQRQDGSSSEKTPFATRVTAFTSGEHPPFRRWSSGNEVDPGSLKFDHAVHLAPRGVMTIDEKQLEKQRADLLAKKVDPDRAARPWKPKKLECSTCHTMDDSGRSMRPISFEKHCQECHPLGVQIVGPWTDPALKEQVWQFGRRRLHHPTGTEKPDLVYGELREALTRFIAAPRSDAFLSVEKGPPPGIDRAPIPEQELRREKEFAWVDRYTRQTAEVLFNGGGGCGYCHTVAAPADVKRLTAPVLKPTNVLTRWWEHAYFKHDSHRMLACTECHDAKTSSKASDVLLPGIATCLKCHDTKQRKARADCVECHAYHDPKEQRAAREKGRLTIDLGPAAK